MIVPMGELTVVEGLGSFLCPDTRCVPCGPWGLGGGPPPKSQRHRLAKVSHGAHYTPSEGSLLLGQGRPLGEAPGGSKSSHGRGDQEAGGRWAGAGGGAPKCFSS